jgi:hypothetical protein
MKYLKKNRLVVCAMNDDRFGLHLIYPFDKPRITIRREINHKILSLEVSVCEEFAFANLASG